MSTCNFPPNKPNTIDTCLLAFCLFEAPEYTSTLRTVPSGSVSKYNFIPYSCCSFFINCLKTK